MRPFGCFKPSIIKELRPVAPLDSWEKEKSSGPLRAASIDVLRFFPRGFRASPLDTLRWPAIKARSFLQAAAPWPFPGSSALPEAALALCRRCSQRSAQNRVRCDLPGDLVFDWVSGNEPSLRSHNLFI